MWLRRSTLPLPHMMTPPKVSPTLLQGGITTIHPMHKETTNPTDTQCWAPPKWSAKTKALLKHYQAQSSSETIKLPRNKKTQNTNSEITSTSQRNIQGFILDWSVSFCTLDLQLTAPPTAMITVASCPMQASRIFPHPPKIPVKASQFPSEWGLLGFVDHYWWIILILILILIHIFLLILTLIFIMFIARTHAILHMTCRTPTGIATHANTTGITTLGRTAGSCQQLVDREWRCVWCQYILCVC